MLGRTSANAEEMLFSDILTNIKDCLIILDDDYKICYWNKGTCNIFGFNQDMIGTSIFTIFNWPELPAILYNSTINYQEVTKKIKTLNNGRKNFRVVFNKVIHPSTSKGYIAITLSDISGLVDATIREKRANLAKSEFLANLSHEIRTPLVGILGYCELLSKAKLDMQETEYVETIEFCANQLMGIIDNVLDLSKIEAGQIEINQQPFNIQEMVKKTISTLQPTIEQKGLICIENIDKQIPTTLIGDEVKIQQVFTNLITNAIKYTDSGYVKVKISTSEYKPSDSDSVDIKLSVSDTGTGIKSNKARSIFNPFIQLNNSEGYNGVGLGLAISKRLIEAMGGNIWYEPHEGGGSVFSFTLTLPVQGDVINEDARQYTTHLSKRKNNKIMLVEDIAINRKLIGIMLEDMGYEVIEATNGAECLSKLQICKPDLIIMDMQMPILDGFETTRQIRQNSEFQYLPIVALTAYAMTKDSIKCIEAGCNYYLSKPFTQAQLSDVLDKCLFGSGQAVN